MVVLLELVERNIFFKEKHFWSIFLRRILASISLIRAVSATRGFSSPNRTPRGVWYRPVKTRVSPKICLLMTKQDEAAGRDMTQLG